MKILKFGMAFAVFMSLSLRPAGAQSDDSPSLFRNGYAQPKVSEVVRLLQRVPSSATLRQIKAVLPRDTQYLWIPMSAMGDWKWNTLQFKGRFSGLLVFANERAKYRFTEREKIQVAQWRATDKVHSVDVFLGAATRDETPQQTVRATRKYVDEIARLLHQRGERSFLKPGDGPGASGWSATWKRHGGRELYFAQDYSYSESQERPTLQLSFAYSHLYQS